MHENQHECRAVSGWKKCIYNYGRLNDIIETGSYYLGIAFLIVLIIDVFAQVLLRYVFEVPFMGAQDIASFSFIWSILLGSSIAVRRKIHLKVEIISRQLSGIKGIIHRYLIHIIMLVFSLVLLKQGLDFSHLGIKRLSPGIGIPMIWCFISFPICSFFMILYVMEDMLKELVNR